MASIIGKTVSGHTYYYLSSRLVVEFGRALDGGTHVETDWRQPSSDLGNAVPVGRELQARSKGVGST